MSLQRCGRTGQRSGCMHYFAGVGGRKKKTFCLVCMVFKPITIIFVVALNPGYSVMVEDLFSTCWGGGRANS